MMVDIHFRRKNMEILILIAVSLISLIICLLDVIMVIALSRNARKIDKKRWKQFLENVKKQIEEEKRNE